MEQNSNLALEKKWWFATFKSLRTTVPEKALDGPTCLLNGQKKKSVPEYTAERVQSEGHMKENPRYISKCRIINGLQCSLIHSKLKCVDEK